MKWKDVPGWSGWYQVSSCGKVRSISRCFRFKRLNQTVTRTLAGRILKQQFSTRGYPKVSLTKPGYRTQPLIHEIVLSAFAGEKPRGLQACHNDGDKRNNKASNLRWDTCQSNINDREKHKKLKQRRVQTWKN